MTATLVLRSLLFVPGTRPDRFGKALATAADMVAMIAILMIVIMENPLNPFSTDKVTVIENPGEADTRITIKDGRTLTRYEAGDRIARVTACAPVSLIDLKMGV